MSDDKVTSLSKAPNASALHASPIELLEMALNEEKAAPESKRHTRAIVLLMSDDSFIRYHAGISRIETIIMLRLALSQTVKKVMGLVDWCRSFK